MTLNKNISYCQTIEYFDKGCQQMQNDDFGFWYRSKHIKEKGDK